MTKTLAEKKLQNLHTDDVEAKTEGGVKDGSGSLSMARMERPSLLRRSKVAVLDRRRFLLGGRKKIKFTERLWMARW